MGWFGLVWWAAAGLVAGLGCWATAAGKPLLSSFLFSISFLFYYFHF
jgi:hypothetical protein